MVSVLRQQGAASSADASVVRAAMSEVAIEAGEPRVSDGVLVDISGFCVSELLDGMLTNQETNAIRTALDRIVAMPSDCANSFQSSI
jgi:hypothetical protein